MSIGKFCRPPENSRTVKKNKRPGRLFLFLKKWKYQLVCVSAGFLLFFLAQCFAAPSSDLINSNYLKRSGYGKHTETYDITVDGLTGGKQKLSIPVSARKYSDDEADRAFDACMDYLSVQILGNNLSLDEVSENLSLPSGISKYGMRAEWTSSDINLLDSFGTVKNADLEVPAEITLKVHLSDGTGEGKHSADYELPVRIIPLNMSEKEKQTRSFLSYLKKQDNAQNTKEGLLLPSEFEGKSLTYSQAAKENYSILWILGIVCAVLFYFREILDRKKAGEKRKQQLLLDYPEIVSKLMVFIGAGMTIRLAWGSIVGDYEAALEKYKNSGIAGKRYAYEEMSRAYGQLKTGVNEGKVYRDFGRSCGLKQYMKLAGLLEQNRKTGIADIRNILNTETAAAWEERKNIARRTGEEASTRLLGPLFIMLMIVMVMIIVPAMMSFT